MNIHEYQAKEILKKYGVKTLKGFVTSSLGEINKIADNLGGNVWVVKAQIHAGGRGKGGGVQVAKSKSELLEKSSKILGMNLITPQTDADGKKVNKIYIEQGAEISRELYFSILIDRKSSNITFLASTEGGMDIEEVAKKSPDKIIRISIDNSIGVMPYHVRRLSYFLELDKSFFKELESFLSSSYAAFKSSDASLLEINPLIVTSKNSLIALDAKMNFDDNALFRQKEILDYRDETEEDPVELIASKYDLSYIKLDGSIGCMVNGAGLAMATMDIIKLNGGEPANFLDVGGGATKEKVTEAFKLIMSDKNVKGILVNIFGGIMRCDIVADGVVYAAREINLEVPLVVRLEGTNVEKGKEILKNSNLKIISADNLGDAAKKIVKSIGKN
ncbi:MAG: Succinyl-CoA ligase [ADP-forming] subunit beta [Alphaproteobacteria bacterium MarineAlpha2_Bin1]|nr:MAG: Succinyl-CoA ligase [ADP-forming] subunit beta [Alphaproteobacteria bacterium MarineAlpha2_Bin1]